MDAINAPPGATGARDRPGADELEALFASFDEPLFPPDEPDPEPVPAAWLPAEPVSDTSPEPEGALVPDPPPRPSAPRPAPSAPPRPEPTGDASAPPVPAVSVSVPGPPAGLRDPRTIISIAAVAIGSLLVGLVAGSALRGGGESPATAPVHPEAWASRVAPIAEWVEKERGLRFAHPVNVRFLSDATYEERVAAARADTDGAGAEPSTEDSAATLRALGLISGEVRTPESPNGPSNPGGYAYYAGDTDGILVRGTHLTSGVKVALAHELTHVLQDQQFDLGRIEDPIFERGEGLEAVAEADAERVASAYAKDELEPDERVVYERQRDAEELRAREEEASLPPALTALSDASHLLGQTLVEVVIQLEGEGAIDDLLGDPPTEEEAFNPAVRGTARAREVEVDAPAPKGAREIGDDTLGPVMLYLMLASRGSPAEALRVIDGWGGAHYTAYRKDGTVCVSVGVTGDEPGHLDALQGALSRWAAGSPAGTAAVSRGEGTVELEACDPGASAARTGAVSLGLMRLPAFRSELTAALAADGLPLPEAECRAGLVVDRVPFAVLVGPGAVTDSRVGQAVTEAAGACR